jgi:hypothetical protein
VTVGTAMSRHRNFRSRRIRSRPGSAGPRRSWSAAMASSPSASGSTSWLPPPRAPPRGSTARCARSSRSCRRGLRVRHRLSHGDRDVRRGGRPSGPPGGGDRLTAGRPADRRHAAVREPAGDAGRLTTRFDYGQENGVISPVNRLPELVIEDGYDCGATAGPRGPGRRRLGTASRQRWGTAVSRRPLRGWVARELPWTKRVWKRVMVAWVTVRSAIRNQRTPSVNGAVVSEPW